MNVLILLAGGENVDIQDGGYPLCLTEIDGVPLIERIANKINKMAPEKTIVCLLDRDVRDYHLDNTISIVLPDAVMQRIPESTKGAACTALLACGEIDRDKQLLIIAANEMLDVDFHDVIKYFGEKELDAGAVCFPSIHPRYSFVRVDKNGKVIEAAEKNPISKNATCGFYWFRKGGDFIDAAKKMIIKDAHVKGSFYICPTINELVLSHKQVGIYNISADKYHPLKSEKQLQNYESYMEDRV